jgi:hypothetical protein
LSARARLASKEPVTVTWCDEVRRRFRRRLRPSRGDSLVHHGRSGLFLRPELHCIPANSHRPAGAGTQYACFDRQAIVLWFNRFTDLKWAGMGFACFGRQAVIQRLNSFTGLKWADMGASAFAGRSLADDAIRSGPPLPIETDPSPTIAPNMAAAPSTLTAVGTGSCSGGGGLSRR